MISLLNVTVRSEASNDSGIVGSGLATISVNNKNYAPQTKGYNVVVFDALSGSFVLNTRLYKHLLRMDMLISVFFITSLIINLLLSLIRWHVFRTVELSRETTSNNALS